jgi:hypothetical protein
MYLKTNTGGPPPEYIRWKLRMMYQCTPSEFEQQRGKYLFEMLRDLRCALWAAKTGK